MASKSSISLLSKVLVEKSGLPQTDAERFVRLMFDLINQSLLTDKIVKVKGFGTFKVMTVKDRESIDVNTGERILIEGRDRITFTPDNILKELVNKPFAQFETVVVNDDIDFSALDEKYSAMEETTSLPETVVEETAEPEIVPEVRQVPEVKQKDIEQPVVPEEKEDIIENTDTFDEEEEKNYEKIIIPTDTVTNDDTVTIDSCPENTPSVSEDAPIPVIESSHEDEMNVTEPSLISDEVTEDVNDGRHVVLPKSLVIGVLALIFVLAGGLCWFAFHYGKLSAMHDQMVQQATKKEVPVQKPAAIAVPTKVATSDSVKTAAKDTTKMTVKPTTKQEVKLQETKPKLPTTESQYNEDPRVRTGAYRIVGVAQTITVKSGQSLRSISKTYLGPGMECYVEAINGITEVKEGQKVKIPKLELKKRSKK